MDFILNLAEVEMIVAMSFACLVVSYITMEICIEKLVNAYIPAIICMLSFAVFISYGSIMLGF